MNRMTCALSALLALASLSLAPGCDDGGPAAADGGLDTTPGDMAPGDTARLDMASLDVMVAQDMMPSPDTAADLGPPPPPPFGPEAVVGTWISEACEPSQGEFIFRQLTLTDTRWQVFGTVFDDSGCTVTMFSFDLQGRWAITDGSHLGADVAEATFVLESSVWTVHQDIYAMAFTINACGSEPWQVGVPQDISETGCIGFAYPVAGCPDGEMDLLRLSEDRLYVGDRGVDLCRQRAIEISEASMRPMPDAVEIDAAAFHPAGVALDAERALYIGAFTSGEIRRAPLAGAAAETLVEPGALGGGARGLAVRDGVLWACVTDLDEPRRSALVHIDPGTGDEGARFPLPEGGICRDIAFAEDGTAYITEASLNDVLRLLPGGDALEVWFDGAGLPPAEAPGFGFAGLVVDLDGSVLVGRADTGTLTRIPVLADGAAGPAILEAVEPLDVTAGIDDLVLWRRGYYAVRNRQLVRLWPGDPWTTDVIADGDDAPTAVAIDRSGNAWAAESQLGPLLDGADAQPPFRVVRHPLHPLID